MFAIQRGILDGQHAAADGVEPHVAQAAAADRVGAGDAHMRVHPGEGAVLEQDVLAEVRGDHAPARAVADVVHPAVDHVEIDHIVRVNIVRSHVDRLPRRADGRVDLVPGGEAVAQGDVGALVNAEKAPVGMPHGGLPDDVVGQAIDLRVRTGDLDVPGPVVVADLLLHPVGKGGKDPAAQDERLFVDRMGLDTGDAVVVPVDVALHRSVPAQDEAVVLGHALVLVQAPPDVAPSLVVLHQDVTVAFGPRSQPLLVPCEPVDLHVPQVPAASAPRRAAFCDPRPACPRAPQGASSMVKRDVFQSVSVAMMAVSARLPRWYVASGFVLTLNPCALAYSCAAQIAGRSSVTPSPIAPKAS